MSLTLETIDQTIEDYPYYCLARSLAQYLSDYGLIDYPYFPERDRYRELSDKDSIYGESLDYECEDDELYPPLTEEEQREYRKLHLKHNKYQDEINTLHESLARIVKQTLTDFDVETPTKLSDIQTLTTSDKTLSDWKNLCSEQNKIKEEQS